MILLLASLAISGPWSASLAGGHDFSVAEPWAGAELVRHPSSANWSAAGRLAGGWGFAEAQPYGFGEIGIFARIPQEDALVRVGALLQTVALAGVDDSAYTLGFVTLVPAAMGSVEFEWGEVLPLTFSARGGVGAARYDRCEDEDESGCYHWATAFAGGFGLRFRVPGGLAVRAELGPTSALAVGYAFGGTR